MRASSEMEPGPAGASLAAGLLKIESGRIPEMSPETGRSGPRRR